MADIQARFSVSAEQIEEDMGYAELDELTSVGNLANYPGFFYFRNNAFVLFFIDEMADIIETLLPQALLNYLGEPDAVWRSQAGKQQKQYVYATQRRRVFGQ